MTDPRFTVGATVWAKGTVVTNESELHRRFGSLASKTHLPGIVEEGYIKPSNKGRQMKYVKALFYYGSDCTKVAHVALSSTRSCPPESANVPTDLAEFVRAGGVPPAVENEQSQSLQTQPPATTIPMGQPSPSDSTTTNYEDLGAMLERARERDRINEARRVSTEAPPTPQVNTAATDDITYLAMGQNGHMMKTLLIATPMAKCP